MPETTNTKSASALNLLESHLDPTSARFEKNMRAMAELVAAVRTEQEKIGEGGGPKAVDAQHAKDASLRASVSSFCWIRTQSSLNSAFMPLTECMKNGAALLPPEW